MISSNIFWAAAIRTLNIHFLRCSLQFYYILCLQWEK
jgi:hypothetical protein